MALPTVSNVLCDPAIGTEKVSGFEYRCVS
jgi:hypothetical protein